MLNTQHNSTQYSHHTINAAMQQTLCFLKHHIKYTILKRNAKPHITTLKQTTNTTQNTQYNKQNTKENKHNTHTIQPKTTIHKTQHITHNLKTTIHQQRKKKQHNIGLTQTIQTTHTLQNPPY